MEGAFWGHETFLSRGDREAKTQGTLSLLALGAQPPFPAGLLFWWSRGSVSICREVAIVAKRSLVSVTGWTGCGEATVMEEECARSHREESQMGSFDYSLVLKTQAQCGNLF